jgi:hypothetical protein
VENYVVAAIGGSLNPASSDDDPCAYLPFVPGQVLVYISPKARRAQTREQLWEVILGALTDGGLQVGDDNQLPTNGGDENHLITTLGGPVYRILLQPGASLSLSQIAAANAALDPDGGLAFSANHIGPFLPNGLFHPDDDPTLLGEGEPGDEIKAGEGQHRVLVVDSPVPQPGGFASIGPALPYDRWDESWDPADARYGQANNQVDFVAGHGAFVIDIIEQYAPSAAITLSAVAPTNVPGRATVRNGWPGFLYAEEDLIAAIETGLGANDKGASTTVPPDGHLPSRRFTLSYDLINMSLGTFGCDDDPHLVLAGVLSDALNVARYDNKEAAIPLIVAAIGNDGGKSPHYPAAFNERKDALGAHVIAVGSHDRNNQRSAYSNDRCTDAWGEGTARAAFPWLGGPGLTEWSGTSFATARVTGGLAATDSTRPLLDTWGRQVALGDRVGWDSAC